MTAVALRKPRPADTWPLIRWRNADAAAFGDQRPLTLGAHEHWWARVYLADPRDHLYVVTCGGRPAGTIGVRLHEDGGREIQRVLLGDKTLARTGVMTAALDALTGMYGPGRYWLRVKAGNDPAVRFYKRNGFTETTRAEGEWLVMER